MINAEKMFFDYDQPKGNYMQQVPVNNTAKKFALIDQLNTIISSSDSGSGLCIMIKPDGLRMQEDEILVQSISQEKNSIVLKPLKISSISTFDVIHESQIFTNFEEFENIQASSKVPKHLVRFDLNGRKIHVSD